MKIDGRTGAALGLVLVLGFGAGFGVRQSMSPDTAATVRATESAVPAALEGSGSDPEVTVLRAQVAQLEEELATTRCTLGSSAGINAYHDGDYDLAIQLYDGALTCDARDGYVLSLKAYSLFKTGDVEGAIAAQRASLEDQPDYALGYFNLARFLCADGDFDAAAEEVGTAIALWPDIEAIAADDGEYQKLCQGRATP